MSDSDTDDAVMRATHRALCDRGYACVTMQDIADEWGKSKAALHYHYDTKEALLVAYLDYLLERFQARVSEEATGRPAERLSGFLDAAFAHADSETDGGFRTAILEIKAQAPYNDAFRERLSAFDSFMCETIADIVADGVEQGQFHDVDPEEVASFVVAAIDGAHTRDVTLDSSTERVRNELEAYLDARLRTEETA